MKLIDTLNFIWNVHEINLHWDLTLIEVCATFFFFNPVLIAEPASQSYN